MLLQVSPGLVVKGDDLPTHLLLALCLASVDFPAICVDLCLDIFIKDIEAEKTTKI